MLFSYFHLDLGGLQSITVRKHLLLPSRCLPQNGLAFDGFVITGSLTSVSLAIVATRIDWTQGGHCEMDNTISKRARVCM
jgi:hypothetical protein